MKHNVAILTLALLFSLTACGQGSEAAPTVIATAESVPTTAEQTEAVSDGVYRVSDVGELLAAIGPDREIRLEQGTYDLTDATGYGKPVDNPYVCWQETYDGDELVIQNVDNLTITGAGQGVSILSATPRYANVLVFRNCGNLSISGITAGHTREPGACVGGVIYLESCENVSLSASGLYGCGTTGVYTDGCTNVSVSDCDIFDCSYNGIAAMNSQNIRISNCELFQLGKEDWDAFEVFSLHNSGNITISDCEIYDNRVGALVRTSGVDHVVLRGNTFRENQVQEYAFGTFGNFVTLDGNVFEGGRIRRWFDAGCGAVDAEGNTITEATMNGIQPEETPAQKVTVTVTDVNGFLAAIAPNTEIVLDGKQFDLSLAENYGGDGGTYYRWEEVYDGYQLVIVGVDNLTIRAKVANRENCQLVTQPRYANVLNFLFCKNIVLSGFTAGHTEGQGECTGGVIYLDSSERIAITDCGLFGCGILGVQAYGCTDVRMNKCEIYECSYGGIQMMNVTGLVLEGCTFRDLGGNNLQLDSCSDVVVDGEPISGWHYDGR